MRKHSYWAVQIPLLLLFAAMTVAGFTLGAEALWATGLSFLFFYQVSYLCFIFEKRASDDMKTKYPSPYVAASFLSGAALSLFAALQMLDLGARCELSSTSTWSLFALFMLIAAAAIWALLKDWKVFILAPDGIYVRTWFKSSFFRRISLLRSLWPGNDT